MVALAAFVIPSNKAKLNWEEIAMISLTAAATFAVLDMYAPNGPGNIAAGARQTSFYQRDPWKRLIRTLSLQNSVTFGTKDEADDSATRINRLHEVINGEDPITGGYYDALDHEQLLWVHACLQLSSIYFYEKTVKKLTDEEKNLYHKENMLAAKLVLVDIDKMPQTHKDLKTWVTKKSRTENYLKLTDVAKDVQEIISGGPVPKHIKPIWPFISFTAFNTLPPEFKKIYGVNSNIFKSLVLSFNLSLLKFTRPLLPPFFRLIPPARWARQRLNKKPNLKFEDKSRI